MSVQTNLNKAEVLFQQGRYNDSSAICRKLLDKKSNLFGALQLEGLNKQAQGELKESIALFEKAIAVNPKNPSTYNNLGNVYLALFEFKKAEKTYQKALAIDPMMAEALNNLANCKVKLGNVEHAFGLYKKAILLDAKNTEYHLNMGVLLTDLGEFSVAQEYLSKALELDSTNTPVYWHIFKIQMYLHRYTDALEVVELAIKSQSLSDAELCELLIGRAMILWLFCEYAEAEQAIFLSEGIYKFQSQSSNMTNMAIFHRYLKQLLIERKNNHQLYMSSTEVEDMYFISESHGFSPNNVIVNYKSCTYQIRSLFIFGAKVFHLIDERDNKYQVSLARLLENLPPKSKIVLGFGEIDCRKDEGIFQYCIKTGNDYRSVIDSMLEKYTETLYQIAKINEFEIILYGVPAPHPYHVNQLSIEHQVMFQNTVAYFNKKLRDCCAKLSITLLDVYMLTNDSGQCNEEYNIDPIHMKPSVINKLFEEIT